MNAPDMTCTKLKDLSIQARWQTRPGHQIRIYVSQFQGGGGSCWLGHWYKGDQGWEVCQHNNIDFPIELLDTVIELLSEGAHQLRSLNEQAMWDEEEE
jgi:hypothetical protein